MVHLARDEGGEMRYAGSAFLTLAGEARRQLSGEIERLACPKPPLPLRIGRQPQWARPELRLRVQHLKGDDHLRHAIVRSVADVNSQRASD